MEVHILVILFCATQQVTDKKGHVLHHVMLGSCGEIPVCINSKVAKLGGPRQLFLNFVFCYFAYQLFVVVVYITLHLERSNYGTCRSLV